MSPADASLASIFICERVLTEKDDVISAIRLVDIYRIPPLPPELTGPLFTKPIVQIVGVAQFRFLRIDGLEHSFQFQLDRPGGESTLVQEPFIATPSLGINGAPGGVNLIVPINVIVKEFGLHYLVALCDGVAVARTPFSFVPLNP